MNIAESKFSRVLVLFSIIASQIAALVFQQEIAKELFLSTYVPCIPLGFLSFSFNHLVYNGVLATIVAPVTVAVFLLISSFFSHRGWSATAALALIPFAVSTVALISAVPFLRSAKSRWNLRNGKTKARTPEIIRFYQ